MESDLYLTGDCSARSGSRSQKYPFYLPGLIDFLPGRDGFLTSEESELKGQTCRLPRRTGGDDSHTLGSTPGDNSRLRGVAVVDEEVGVGRTRGVGIGNWDRPDGARCPVVYPRTLGGVRRMSSKTTPISTPLPHSIWNLIVHLRTPLRTRSQRRRC